MERVKDLPKDWQSKPHNQGVRLIAPASEVTKDFVDGALKQLFAVGTFQGEPVSMATNHLDFKLVQPPTMAVVKV